MNPHTGFGGLARILQDLHPRRIFLVTGKASFAMACGAGQWAAILAAYETVRFCDFATNPRIEDIEQGRALLNESGCDVVLAVGGGSVLDMAKSVNVLAAQDGPAGDYLNKTRTIRRRGLPLIAIPTTAGSGSEATHFAVAYVGKIKHSLAHPFMLPDYALLDPATTLSLPPYLTASTGLDALSQAIESYWSIHSTPVSSAYAEQAIRLILGHLPAAVNRPTAEARQAMLHAANLAGRAINISKTTAPHALSYPLTMHFGVPHGHAAGLTLAGFFVFNSQVGEQDVADQRGAGHVRRRIEALCALLGAEDAPAAAARINALMHDIGLTTDLAACGVKTPADIELILGEINLERLDNNPRRLTLEDLRQLLTMATTA